MTKKVAVDAVPVSAPVAEKPKAQRSAPRKPKVKVASVETPAVAPEAVTEAPARSSSSTEGQS